MKRLWVLFLLCAHLRSATGFRGSIRSLRTCACQASVTEDSPSIYSGPVADNEEMCAGWTLPELGLNVMVGPSKVASGLGLFVSLAEDAEETTLEKGTVLCAYCKEGTFAAEYEGDKTVAYALSDPTVPVVFERRIMPLHDVIAEVKPRVKDFHALVHGYSLRCSEDGQQMGLTANPDQAFAKYFIPCVKTDENLDITNVGVYANDLAYSPTADGASYEANCEEKNVLLLIWRLAFEEQQLRPTWPVVMLSKSLTFRNKEPMEVGLTYSWRYWEFWRSTQESV